MLTDGSAAPVTLPDAGEKSGAWRRASLRWMAELEASLERSRRALLALDLIGIEAQTQKQAVLVRRFDEFMREGLRVQAGIGCAADGDRTERSLLPPALEDEEEEEVRHNANRILQAARLQSALLTRAQQKLRVLASMLAGPSVTYGPFLSSANFVSRERI